MEPSSPVEAVSTAAAPHLHSSSHFDSERSPAALFSSSALLAPDSALHLSAAPAPSAVSAPVAVPPPVSVEAKTSKYDFVKVRIWQQGHYQVLSRYLVARSLTDTLMPKPVAIRISLRCKKRLVDAGRLDVTADEWKRVIEEEVAREEESGKTKINMDTFKMSNWFQSSRTPLLVLLYGNALIGKSAAATKLSNHMNFSSIVQSQMVYRVGCSIEDERERERERERNEKEGGEEEKEQELPSSSSPPSARRHTPLYLLDYSSQEELEAEYSRRCVAVRAGLQRDLNKLLAEGRSVIMEGTLIDPNLFKDAFLPTPSNTSGGGAEALSPPFSSSTAAPLISPIVVSFHVSLPMAKQMLLLHNYFANQQPAPFMPAQPLPPLLLLSAASSTSSAASSFFPPPADAAAASLLSTASNSSTSPPPPPSPSPALLLRNLAWLDDIIRRRHEQWKAWTEGEAKAETAAAAPSSSLSSPSLSLPTPSSFEVPHSVSLDAGDAPSFGSSPSASASPPPTASRVDLMHALVLDAMKKRMEHTQQSQQGTAADSAQPSPSPSPLPTETPATPALAPSVDEQQQGGRNGAEKQKEEGRE